MQYTYLATSPLATVLFYWAFFETVAKSRTDEIYE